MMKTAALLSCVATATAFQSSSFSGSQVAAVTSAKGGMSMAFEQKWFPNKQLVKTPEKLDGTMIGDAGFDPMGITEQLTDLNYVRGMYSFFVSALPTPVIMTSLKHTSSLSSSMQLMQRLSSSTAE